MSHLVICQQCKNEFYGQERICPLCGTAIDPSLFKKLKKKKANKETWLGCFIGLILTILMICFIDAHVESDRENFKKSFNDDGSHPGLIKIVKKNLERSKHYDVKTFKHVKTIYRCAGDWNIYMTYYVNNKDGEKIQKYILVDVDLNGVIGKTLIEGIIEKEKRHKNK